MSKGGGVLASTRASDVDEGMVMLIVLLSSNKKAAKHNLEDEEAKEVEIRT